MSSTLESHGPQDRSQKSGSETVVVGKLTRWHSQTLSPHALTSSPLQILKTMTLNSRVTDHVAELTYSTAHACPQDTRLATGSFCSVSIYKLHLEEPSIVVVCGYVVLLCYGCCTRQERINASAVLTDPRIFFQPLSSCSVCRGFSEQWAQWDVCSKTTGNTNRINKTVVKQPCQSNA